MGYAGARAGLIRDTPKLIAPTEVYAYPGRGGLLVYELDKDGNRVPEPETKDQPKQQTRRRRRRPRGRHGWHDGWHGWHGQEEESNQKQG